MARFGCRRLLKYLCSAALLGVLTLLLNNVFSEPHDHTSPEPKPEPKTEPEPGPKTEAEPVPRSFPVLANCNEVSPLLVGPCPPRLDLPPSLEEIQNKSAPLSPGGLYSPPDCRAQHRSAIVIPYRNRSSHLHTLLDHLHPILQRQQIQYRIYVVEQWGQGTFNKGRLLNAGVQEALRDDNWTCIIPHDVDLLLEDDRNTYSCQPNNPTHLSVAIDKFNYVLPYASLLGGVVAIAPDHFKRMNGYSNKFWGWGGEDDDLSNRVYLSGMKVVRPPVAYARYKMITHKHDKGNAPNPNNVQLLKWTRNNWRDDGLNSLTFKLLSKDLEALYTKLTVDVGGESPT
ncbi:beta-1,4-galactosyltransferase 3-like [Corythoichthys intestinalis]|uniref:beta-1,4-galactosyltransferase 3-like n=1 Tax=Corythoichthys intestinalis TaxID=161448 RepID=UPI0025A5FE12|nr:beta-1,4-galactosyltransferase 3-like [Corythoichthys intestinalis]